MSLHIRISNLMAILFLFLIATCLGASVSAQDSMPVATASVEESDLRFGIVPTDPAAGGFFDDVVVNPGETVSLQVAVVNVGNVAAELRVYRTNASISINGGFIAGSSEDEVTSPTTWVNFEPFEAELNPDTQHIIDFTVTVPDGTLPGQYISALVVETVDTYKNSESDVFDHRIRYAMTVGILVPGEMHPQFSIGEPSWEQGIVYVPIQNTGNYLVKPTGDITIRNSVGDEVMVVPVQMGSVYAGLPSAIAVAFPPQLPPGEYRLDIGLTDPQSGFAADESDVLLVVPEAEDPNGIYLREHGVDPNAEDIAFANVRVILDNGGPLIPVANVSLEVFLDGAHVEDYPLATNQQLVNGENTITGRYIPANVWEPGTYTFRLVVHTVDPNGGTEIELLNEDIDAEITVP